MSYFVPVCPFLLVPKCIVVVSVCVLRYGNILIISFLRSVFFLCFDSGLIFRLGLVLKTFYGIVLLYKVAGFSRANFDFMSILKNYDPVTN